MPHICIAKTLNQLGHSGAYAVGVLDHAGERAVDRDVRAEHRIAVASSLAFLDTRSS